MHHVPAERREPASRGVGGGRGPRETAPVGERDVADAERREHPQRAERVLDGVPTLDADQTRDLPRLEVPLTSAAVRARARSRGYFAHTRLIRSICSSAYTA